MKKILLATLLTTTALTPVLAEEITASTRIDAVTVFPSGAEITRKTKINVLKGEHTLILKDLPADVDPQSIRVSGKASGDLEIWSIDSNLSYVNTEDSILDQRKEIESEIESLNDKIASNEKQLKTIEYQRQLIQESAIRPIRVTVQDGTDISNNSLDLGALFDLIAERLQALDGKTHQIQINTREARKEIKELQLELTELAPRQDARVDVAIDFASNQSMPAVFHMKYRIQNAGWHPFYDARLNIDQKGGKPKLTLTRRAQIVQSKTEQWNNVSITLSTARSTGTTAVPRLQPVEFAAVYRPLPYALSDEALKSASQISKLEAVVQERAAAQSAPEQEMREADARQISAGFQAIYKIDGRFTVDNRGTAKKVRIASETLDATLSVHAAPLVDLNAYLTAIFTPAGEHPLLPGRVMLFRDNVYMGQGHVPLIASGEEHKLGFGTDDRIRIKRSKTKRKTGESGILTTEHTEENSWITEITNRHDQKMSVLIYDRMPYAVHEDTEISLLRDVTPPTGKNIDNRQGIFAWEQMMEPGDTKEIRFGYLITHPQS